MKTFATLTILILPCLFLCVSKALQGRTPIIPPSTESVAGAWIGFSDGQVSFLRIEFTPDGTGYLAVTEVGDQPASVFLIRKWTPKNNDIDILLRPVKKTDDSMIVYRALWGQTSIDIQYGGKGWKKHALLFRESYFVLRDKEAKAAIAHLRIHGGVLGHQDFTTDQKEKQTPHDGGEN